MAQKAAQFQLLHQLSRAGSFREGLVGTVDHRQQACRNQDRVRLDDRLQQRHHGHLRPSAETQRRG